MSSIKTFFTPKPPRYYTPERLKEDIIVYLTPSQPGPDRVPSELQNDIPKIIWDERLSAISKRSTQYYKPLFERIYFCFAALAVLILPMGLYQIISHSMTLNLNEDESAKQFFQAKAITFGIFLGTILVFFGPIFLWKWLGQRRMNTLIMSYAMEDKRSSNFSNARPTWKCSTPGLFRASTRVTISIPAQKRAGSPFNFYGGDTYRSAYGHSNGMSKEAFDFGGPRANQKGARDSVIGKIQFPVSPAKSAFSTFEKV